VLAPRKTWRLGNGLTGMAPILPKNQTHDDCQSFDTCRNAATAVTSLGQPRLARGAPKQLATS
jgi:hypothetical protein